MSVLRPSSPSFKAPAEGQPLPPASAPVPRVIWRRDGIAVPESLRPIPMETPIAFSYQGTSYAVMMGSPADLEDFAVGFSLSEGIVRQASDIEDLEITSVDDGIVLRMTLITEPAAALWDRRRRIAGPSGCGLCGLESLGETLRPSRQIESGLRIAPEDIAKALELMPALQTINSETRAVHAAAFWQPDHGIVALREDVGRHNALDKLAGAVARAGIDAGQGIVLLTSRVSVEMVQKTATMGAPILVAVSAPTALALKAARAAGLTLAAIARPDGFEVFNRPDRVGL